MLRDDTCLLSVDLRDLMGVSPQVLNDLYRKIGVEFAQKDGHSGRGRIKHIPGSQVKKIIEHRGFSYPKKCTVMSFLMCKGGVGKTTSSFFVAHRLSSLGFKVLVVDTDMQGSLTSAFSLGRYGYEIDSETPVIADIVTGECDPKTSIIEVTSCLHLIPSTPLNANLDSKIRDKFKNFSLVYNRLVLACRGDYDYIIFDCAPALNLANTAAVCVSDVVVMPVAPDKFSQIGLEQTMEEINQIEKDFSCSTQKKILFTKYDAREFLSFKYLAEIVQKYNHRRYSTAIRTSTDLKNVITRNEDLFLLRRSHARHDYGSLCLEITGMGNFFKSRTNKRAKKNRDAA